MEDTEMKTKSVFDGVIVVTILRDETRRALDIALGRKATEEENQAFIEDLQFVSSEWVMSQAMVRAASIKRRTKE